jgi:hypothetical protein
LQDGEFCFMHSPDHAEEVAEARRLGGLRRRREKTVAGAFEFQGLASVGQIRRLVEIAVLDTLGLENSIARARTLAYLAIVSQMIEQLYIRLARLKTLNLWAMTAFHLASYICTFTREPVTRSEYERRAAEARSSIVSASLLAETLVRRRERGKRGPTPAGRRGLFLRLARRTHASAPELGNRI